MSLIEPKRYCFALKYSHPAQGTSARNAEGTNRSFKRTGIDSTPKQRQKREESNIASGDLDYFFYIESGASLDKDEKDDKLSEEQLDSLQLPSRNFKNRPNSEVSRLTTAYALRDATMTFTPSHVRLAERSNKAEKVKLEKMKILLETKLEMFEIQHEEFEKKKKDQEKLNKVFLSDLNN